MPIPSKYKAPKGFEAFGNGPLIFGGPKSSPFIPVEETMPTVTPISLSASQVDQLIAMLKLDASKLATPSDLLDAVKAKVEGLKLSHGHDADLPALNAEESGRLCELLLLPSSTRALTAKDLLDAIENRINQPNAGLQLSSSRTGDTLADAAYQQAAAFAKSLNRK